MNIEYLAIVFLIALLYFRFKTNLAIYAIFAGMVSLFLAITLAASAMILTVIFALLGVYLFYEAIYL